MRVLMSIVFVLAWAMPSCVRYGSRQGEADAGRDAVLDAQPADDGGPRGDDTAGDDGTTGGYEGGDGCERVTNVVSGREGLCIPPGVPCGFAVASNTCNDDSHCPPPGLCWDGRCLRPDPAAGGEGCVEARLHLRYGGTAPDRIYEYTLDLQAPRREDGSYIDAAEDWYLHNPVPCMPVGGECISYHRPVEAHWIADSMRTTGASGFTLYKLRTTASASLGPGWQPGAPLEFYWTFDWDFGLGANEQAAWFQSELTIVVWSIEDGCTTRVSYAFTLVPDEPRMVAAEPERQEFCRD